MVTKRSLTIPRVIGHRGAAARAPENTLAGFRKAAELGCIWVEFDVRLSGDDRPVVIHDATLDRPTDGSGVVGAMPLAELQKRDAGGEPIPTLDSALAGLRLLGLGGNVEMKADTGREEALAAAVANAVRRHAAPLLVSSFSWPTLEAFVRLAPTVPRGLLTERLTPDWPDAASRLGAAVIACDQRHLNPDAVETVRGAGYLLAAYTVNEPSRALELFAWGVNSVFSDAPDLIFGALAHA
jgi:glycerophosphoryl diester phosphodiesterase